MTKRSLWRLAAALLVPVALALPARLFAQSNVTTSDVEGTVKDETGAALPGVSVEAHQVDTGFKRLVTTGADGRYQLLLLPPGRYSVTASLSGFSSVKRDGLVLSLGVTSRVDITLRLATVTETVTVTGQAPVVEATKTEVSASVNQDQIKNLPLQTRNFTNLVILTPGASDDNTNRVHLSGQRGINNSFNVDGADSNSSFFGEQRGGTRPPFTFSQGAIQEFQVVTSSYNAQYGNATGGIINAITKSGTNDFHGEVFGFYRSKALSQKDANGFIGQDFEQKQFGGFIGGPIVKDKLFFFGGYDGQRLKDPFQAAYVNEGTSSDPLNNPANLAALQRYGIDPATEWGTITQTNDVDSPFVKLTWNASDSVSVYVRDNYNNEKGLNLTNGPSFASAGISNNGLEKNFFNSLVGNVNWVASASLFDELIVQTANEHRPRQPNSVELPETSITQFGSFGQNNFLPNNLDENRFQVIDNVTLYVGNNTIRAGVDYSHVKYSDEFFRYRFGVYAFSSMANFTLGKVNTYRQSFSDYGGLVDYTSDYISGYVQDEWRPNNRLTVNFGIRYEYQRQPDSVDVNPLYPDVQSIPSDTNNWAPRLGIAWDPEGNGKGVLRGGVGVFYATTPSLLTANSLLNNGIRVLDYQITCNAAGTNCPTYPNILADPGSLAANKSNIFVFERGFQNTETARFSLGYEREVVKDIAVGVDLIYAKSRRLERVKDMNLVQVGYTPDGRPRYGAPRTPTRSNPNFAAIQQFTADGDGEYKGILFSVRKRFSKGFLVNASYSWGDSRDNQSNERSVSISGNTTEDNFNPNWDYGPSDYDVRHNVVISAVADLGWGFRLSPFFRWRSGQPYSPGNSVDVNGDGILNDRANDLVNCDSQGRCDLGPNHAGRNSARQPDFSTLDATLSKDFVFGGVTATLYVQGFNLLHSSNRYISSNTNQVISGGTVSGVQKYSLNPNYAIPDRAGSPRQFQLGVRISM